MPLFGNGISAGAISIGYLDDVGPFEDLTRYYIVSEKIVELLRGADSSMILPSVADERDDATLFVANWRESLRYALCIPVR